MIVGNERQIPKVVTFPPGATGDFRYVVVVKMQDRVSGQKRETLHEIFSDVPILSIDVQRMAVQNSLAQIGNDTITGARGVDVSWGEPRATIISVSQRP